MKISIINYIARLVAVLVICVTTQAFAHVEEFSWNGEIVHLETPTPITVCQGGPLLQLMSTDQTGDYNLWITGESAIGLSIDQAILMILFNK